MIQNMRQLDVSKQMADVFGGRQLHNHAAKRSMTIYAGDRNRIIVVLGLSESRKILTSRNFSSINYFAPGYKLDDCYSLVRRFFQESPLFLEGEEHRHIKKIFDVLLKQQMKELEINSPLIRKYMKKRKKMFETANQFGHAFVEICLGIMISNLASTSLKISLSALRARRNVFYFHFEPRRHKLANAALGILGQSFQQCDKLSKIDHKMLLCQSFVLMAYDPLVATIVASIVEGRTKDLQSNTDVYCPVSFVSRVCEKPTTIGEVSFKEGDICYVSLVPASDDKAEKSFPFGSGRHICSGQKISIQMLKLAGEIIEADFKEGFRKNPVLSPDGSFLSFRD